MSSIITRRRLQARRARRSQKARPIIIALVGLLAFGSVCAAAGIGALFTVYNSYAHDYVPIEEKLQQRNVGLTAIYDRNGPDGANAVLLGQLTNPDAQLLEPVPLDQISPYLVAATISTEDNSFWDNPGINFTGLSRAAIERYVKNDTESGTGGSSITQQLVKNVYICPNINTTDDPTRCVNAERTLDRKLREIVYAVELTNDYTKEEILTWYLNQISYADRYVGIEAASQGYFHKPAKDLTLGEAALLAGVPQFPTKYHPRYNCVATDDGTCVLDNEGRTTVAGEAKTRQEAVLDLMVVHGRATADEVAAAKAEEIHVYAASNPLKAEAWIDNQVEPRLVRMCKAGLLPKPKEVDDCENWVHSAGYKVTSSLDYTLTEQARQMSNEWVAAGLAAGCECHNAAVVTIEPTTGQIIVYSPNIDPTYRSDPRVAGNIDQLSEINQPGSSFKPAVYLNWFDTQNKAPMSIFWDTSPLSIGGVDIVNPRQNGPTEGLISARAALGGSQNVGAFRAAAEGGVDNVIEMAKKLGITTLSQGFDPTFSNQGRELRRLHRDWWRATSAQSTWRTWTRRSRTWGRWSARRRLPEYADIKTLKSTSVDVGADYDLAWQQALEIPARKPSHPRHPRAGPHRRPRSARQGREPGLQGTDPQTKQVVNAGSVWLLHSIMSDCTARFVIWSCGGSNTDLGLDFSDGVKIPSGVKTGTQQAPRERHPRDLDDRLQPARRHRRLGGQRQQRFVNDRAARPTPRCVRLWKSWMGAYHSALSAHGVGDRLQRKVSATSNLERGPALVRDTGNRPSARRTSYSRPDRDGLGADGRDLRLQC
ncbi:MAG: transglycosylase domain-containing protein [Dehalococcoidia bacterium]